MNALVHVLAVVGALSVAPLAALANPPCGATLTASTTLTADMDCTSCTTTVLTIGAPDVRLDGAGYKIIAPNAATVVYVNAARVIVTNLDVSRDALPWQGDGVKLNGGVAHRCTIRNVRARYRSRAVYASIYSLQVMTIEGCDLSQSDTGIYLVTDGFIDDVFISGNNLSWCNSWAVHAEAARRCVVTTSNDLTGAANGIWIGPNSSIQDWDLSRFDIRGTVLQFGSMTGNPGDSVTVRNCNVSRLAREGIGTGVKIACGTNCVIENVDASGRNIGLYLIGSNNQVRSNDVSHCSGDAIYATYRSASARTGWVVSGNNCSYAGGWGLSLAGLNAPSQLKTNSLTGCLNGLWVGDGTTIEDWDMRSLDLRGTAIASDGSNVTIRNVDVSRPDRDGLGTGILLGGKNPSNCRVENVKASGRATGLTIQPTTDSLTASGNAFVGNDLSSCTGNALEILPGSNVNCRHSNYYLAGNNCSGAGGWGITLDYSSGATITTSNVLTGCANGILCGARTVLNGFNFVSAAIPGTMLKVVDRFGDGGNAFVNLDVSRSLNDGQGTGLWLVDVIGPRVENVNASGRDIGILHSLKAGLRSIGAQYVNCNVSNCRTYGLRLECTDVTPSHQSPYLSNVNAANCGIAAIPSGWGLSLPKATAATIDTCCTAANSANGIEVGPESLLDRLGANLLGITGTAVRITGANTRVTSARLTGTVKQGTYRRGIAVDLSGAADTILEELDASVRDVGIQAVNSPRLTLRNSDVKDCRLGISLATSANAAIYHNNFGANLTAGVSGDAPLELSATPAGATTAQGSFWGRSCPGALFVTGPATGSDSSRIDLVDSHPYARASGWNLRDGTGCAGLINQPPTVEPSTPTPYVIVFNRVLLSAGAVDLDHNPLSYSWTQLIGPTVTLEGAASASAAFTPSSSGAYRFSVSVSDGVTAPVTATVDVTAIADTVAPQVVSVGFIPAMPVSQEGLVLILATFSEPMSASPAPRVRFVRETGGMDLPEAGMTPTALASQYSYGFYAPAGLDGTWRVEFTGRDLAGNALTVQPTGNRMQINVPVTNRPPLADAGRDRACSVGSSVVLTGTATDSDAGDTLSYEWSQVSGPETVQLLDALTARAHFTPTLVGTYLFKLRVTDGRGGVGLSQTVVTVLEPRPDLIVSQLRDVPASVALGAWVPVMALVQNLSSQMASPQSRVRFVLSLDPNISTTDSSLGEAVVPGLAAPGSALTSPTAGVRVPLGLAPGTYWLGAIVNPANLVDESNTANNSARASSATSVVVAVTDDNPANDISALTTAPVLPVDAPARAGALEIVGDVDVFGVELTASQDYLFTVEGGSFLSELTLFTPRREPLKLEYNTCGQTQARLRWRAMETGLHYLELRAHNNTTSGPYGLRAARLTPLAIQTTTLPVGSQGSFYATTLTASGGVPPYRWSLLGISPALGGLSLEESTGRLRGTPAGRGGYTLDVVLGDSDCAASPPAQARSLLTMQVTTPTAVAPLRLTTPAAGAVIAARLGHRLLVPLGSEGGLLPYTYGLAPGSAPLPSGMQILEEFLFGAPVETGLFPVTLRVIDGRGDPAHYASTSTVNFDVKPSPPPVFEVQGGTADRGKILYRVLLSSLEDELTSLQFTLDYDATRLAFDARLGENYPAGPLVVGTGAVLRVLQAASGKLVVTIVTPSGHPIVQTGELLGLRFTGSGGSGWPASLVRLSDIVLVTPLGRVVLQPPTANAGFDQVVRVKRGAGGRLEALIPDPADEGRVKDFARLDGRGCVDPNLPPQRLTYLWIGPGGVALQGPASVTPTFAPTGPGVVEFSLTASNAQFSSKPATVRLIAMTDEASPPTALPRLSVAAGAAKGWTPGKTPGLPRYGLAPQVTPSDPMQQVLAGQDFVVLDGRLSADSDARDRASLTYRWRQLDGPARILPPGSETLPVVTVAPAAAGLYRFELIASDPGGLAGVARTIAFQAVPPDNHVPRLTLWSQLMGSTTTGEAQPEGLATGHPRSLAVELPAQVRLLGRAEDPDVGSDARQQRLRLKWSQLDGPIVQLEQAEATVGTSLELAATFEPTAAGVYTFRLEAEETDSLETPTGVKPYRDISVNVSAPVAIASVGTGSAPPQPGGGSAPRTAEVTAGNAVFLAGAAGAVRTGQPVFRWSQLEGPTVLLSNPFSPVTTFVAPAGTSEGPMRMLFQLTVDDGTVRSQPDLVQVTLNPDPSAPPPPVVDTTAPTAALTYSLVPALYAEGGFAVTATFSESITPAAPSIAIEGGAASTANDVTATAMQLGPDRRTWVYRRTIMGEQADDGLFLLTLTAHDAAGNPLAQQPANRTFTIRTQPSAPPADTTSPTATLIYSAYPAEFSEGGFTVIATFNEEITPDAPSIAIGGGAASTANDVTATAMSLGADRRTWVYRRTIVGGQVDDGTFTITLTAGDAAGNALVVQPENRSFTVQTRSTAQPSFTVSLGAGLNYVSFPMEPTEFPTLNSRTMLERLGCRMASRLELAKNPAGFVTDVENSSMSLFLLGAGDGVVLMSGGAHVYTLPGRAWPAGSRSQALKGGLNLIGPPVEALTFTAQQLASQTGSRFVVGTQVDGQGVSRARVYLPDGLQDFAIQPGRAYLLSLPVPVTLTWPASP